MGLGLASHIPLIAYLGFWIMCIVALTGRPLYGLYYALPFVPYRTMRDHLLEYPLGANTLTILIVCILVGALLHGKRLPKSKMFVIWGTFAVYLYISLWVGTALGNAPAPIWLNDINFVTWKDYMVIPLLFVASALVLEDRKAIRNTVIIIAIAVLFVDRSSLFESLTRTWTTFDEDKRSGGPLGYGSNQTAAFLAQFCMFFWGVTLYLKRVGLKLLSYGLVACTAFATMYTFSRGAYVALLFSVLVLAILKDRKLLLFLAIFAITWQTVVPTPVQQRVLMTKSADGQLDESAQERVSLWENAETAILRSPIIGAGFATFQLRNHVDGLRDTHNWYVKVMVETGVIGLLFAFLLLQQMISTGYRLYRNSKDRLYEGLGLGLFLATISCAVANIFGDRWTYLEITGLLWVLVAAAIKASSLSTSDIATQATRRETEPVAKPFLAYR